MSSFFINWNNFCNFHIFGTIGKFKLVQKNNLLNDTMAAIIQKNTIKCCDVMHFWKCFFNIKKLFWRFCRFYRLKIPSFLPLTMVLCQCYLAWTIANFSYLLPYLEKIPALGKLTERVQLDRNFNNILVLKLFNSESYEPWLLYQNKKFYFSISKLWAPVKLKILRTEKNESSVPPSVIPCQKPNQLKKTTSSSD